MELTRDVSGSCRLAASCSKCSPAAAWRCLHRTPQPLLYSPIPGPPRAGSDSVRQPCGWRPLHAWSPCPPASGCDESGCCPAPPNTESRHALASRSALDWWLRCPFCRQIPQPRLHILFHSAPFAPGRRASVYLLSTTPCCSPGSTPPLSTWCRSCPDQTRGCLRRLRLGSPGRLPSSLARPVSAPAQPAAASASRYLLAR